jgi:hypothetical protein
LPVEDTCCWVVVFCTVDVDIVVDEIEVVLCLVVRMVDVNMVVDARNQTFSISFTMDSFQSKVFT